jgi:hypothetical protein
MKDKNSPIEQVLGSEARMKILKILAQDEKQRKNCRITIF